ncbi:MAG: hypothetical protein ACE5I7_06915 [Candidatus Binatia bacterium]
MRTPTRTPFPTAGTPVGVTPTPTASPSGMPTAQLVVRVLPTDSTISLDDATAFPPSGTIQIEDEQLSYAAKFGNTLTGVVHGVNGTTPAEHEAGLLVSFLSAVIATPAPPTATSPPRGRVIRVIGKGAGCAIPSGDHGGSPPDFLIAIGLAAWCLRRWGAQ